MPLFCVSLSRACRHLPTARRPALTGFMKLSTTAIALWRDEILVGIRLITRRGQRLVGSPPMPRPVLGSGHQAASSSQTNLATLSGGAFSCASPVGCPTQKPTACRPVDAAGLLVVFAELATKLREDPACRQARPPRRGFVMTDELMLFLALLAAFTVVLVEWWARRRP